MGNLRDQTAKIGEALVAVARHPADVARFARALDRDDGAALGWWLRGALSPEGRRALGAAVLADDDVVFELDGGGYSWAFPAGDDIAVSLLSIGGYSAGEAVAVGAWVRANRRGAFTTVIDVGANVGTTALPFGSDGWDVLAYEPVATTYGFLARNVAANGLADRVRAVRAAVSDRPGTAAMAVSRRLGASHIIDRSRPAQASDQREEVPVTTLDAVVTEHDLEPSEIAVVWCDAEGSESAVIAGGSTLWAAGVPLWAECGIDDAAAFVEAARSHFRAFVPEHEVRAAGTGARPHPISELDADLVALTGINNVLLVPGSNGRFGS